VELLQFNIAAGETKRYEVAGRYLEIIEAADRLNIEFNGPDGNRVHSMRGALSGFYSEEPFGAFEVTNPGAAQTVTLMITDRRGGSRRQPGNVRIVDQSIDKTRAQNQFWGSVGVGASVGQASWAWLQPNGRQVAVKAIAVQSSIAGPIFVGRAASAGTAAGGFNPFNGNKFFGALASLARVSAGFSAGVNPTAAEIPGYIGLANLQVPANTLINVPLGTPILLEGTNALVITGNALNRDVTMLVDYEEA
jgi:hypothetical protein